MYYLWDNTLSFTFFCIFHFIYLFFFSDKIQAFCFSIFSSSLSSIFPFSFYMLSFPLFYIFSHPLQFLICFWISIRFSFLRLPFLYVSFFLYHLFLYIASSLYPPPLWLLSVTTSATSHVVSFLRHSLPTHSSHLIFISFDFSVSVSSLPFD